MVSSLNPWIRLCKNAIDSLRIDQGGTETALDIGSHCVFRLVIRTCPAPPHGMKGES